MWAVRTAADSFDMSRLSRLRDVTLIVPFQTARWDFCLRSVAIRLVSERIAHRSAVVPTEPHFRQYRYSSTASMINYPVTHHSIQSLTSTYLNSSRRLYDTSNACSCDEGARFLKHSYLDIEGSHPASSSAAIDSYVSGFLVVFYETCNLNEDDLSCRCVQTHGHRPLRL